MRFLADLSLFLALIALSTMIRADLLFSAAYLFLFAYCFITNRRPHLRNLFLALIVATAWTFAGAELYGYQSIYLSIGNLNLYPLATWSVGLFLILLLVQPLWNRFGSTWSRIVAYCVVYWVCLIGYETYAYHVLGIHNPTTSQYPGLPLCDCIHAPRWMQAVYLALGPLYVLLVSLFRQRPAGQTIPG